VYGCADSLNGQNTTCYDSQALGRSVPYGFRECTCPTGYRIKGQTSESNSVILGGCGDPFTGCIGRSPANFFRGGKFSAYLLPPLSPLCPPSPLPVANFFRKSVSAYLLSALSLSALLPFLLLIFFFRLHPVPRRLNFNLLVYPHPKPGLRTLFRMPRGPVRDRRMYGNKPGPHVRHV
jgi:hypothetical protein